MCWGNIGGSEQGKTESVIKQQLSILSGFEGEFMVAYEPVWAIGTGKAATPEMAQMCTNY